MAQCFDVEIRSICRDWYEGKESTMYAVGWGHDYNPALLVKEAERALAGCRIRGELARLRKLKEYAERERERGLVHSAITRAARRARAVGISWDEFKAIAGGEWNG